MATLVSSQCNGLELSFDRSEIVIYCERQTDYMNPRGLYSRRYGALIERLRREPGLGHTLNGRMVGQRSCAVNRDHRVVYAFNSSELRVLDCGPHKKVY
ncbi:hypothetical protein AVEN_140804-1 [Araneus ventricosus]|uniref:Uncharacterized protein n=1 Tax=Araneus ventricosus TaxID=182803 RepID=A0A4Y2UBS4_ARAVE|nr:hypothetical protein AVEN_140804-1 [Araneus ventricosus]